MTISLSEGMKIAVMIMIARIIPTDEAIISTIGITLILDAGTIAAIAVVNINTERTTSNQELSPQTTFHEPWFNYNHFSRHGAEKIATVGWKDGQRDRGRRRNSGRFGAELESHDRKIWR